MYFYKYSFKYIIFLRLLVLIYNKIFKNKNKKPMREKEGEKKKSRSGGVS